MRNLLKVSEFSRLAGVTVKALHLYDRIGVLTPAWVDPDTGYRLYSLDQLARLNRIRALKDLGFSLQEISRVLDEEPSRTDLEGMLQRKRSELEQQIATVQQQLVHVNARSRRVRWEGLTGPYAVTLKQVEPMTVASTRGVEPTVISMVHRTYEVSDLVRASRARITGPTLALFYHGGFREADLDVELAVPIAPQRSLDIPASSGRHVRVRKLTQRVRVASLIWQGDGGPLHEAYAAMDAWIHENRYSVSEPIREIYLRDGPQREKVFEIQYPICN